MSYFKAGVSTPTAVESPSVDTAVTKSGENIIVPYLDYKSEVGKPYSVDYFELGDHWNDGEGGFVPEVETIESYLKGLIESGRMDNKVESVKERLKQVEKAVGLTKDERTVVKMGKIAAYIKFLSETNDIETNARKYGTQ